MRKGYHKKYKKYCRQLGITLEEGKESCQEILIDWEHHLLFYTYLNLYYITYLVVYNKENPFEATKCCRLCKLRSNGMPSSATAKLLFHF